MKIKLYIGCALTDAPQEFREMVDELKDMLREEYEILDFIGLVNGTPTDVYHWDIHRCVAQCHMLIAICDYGATGLGWEMGTAVEKYGKPVLALAHEDSRVTRLVLGVDHPNYTWERYQTTKDIIRLIRRKELQHFSEHFLQLELEMELC